MSTTIKTAINGFSRIGGKRELKTGLEAFWSGNSNSGELLALAQGLRARHWQDQINAGIDYISVNDFSLYDNMLDTLITFGAIPSRVNQNTDELSLYFELARGSKNARALGLKKWFNTNYHYLTPELTEQTKFRLNPAKVLGELAEARALGHAIKLHLIGPLNFLKLSHFEGRGDSLDLLPGLLNEYAALLRRIFAIDKDIVVQFDEPILVNDPDARLLDSIEPSYLRLQEASGKGRLIICTYFDHAGEALPALKRLPVWGLGLDFVHGLKNLDHLDGWQGQKLFAGIVNGRNVWKNDPNKSKSIVKEIAKKIGLKNLVISSSCSLLHVPYSLGTEAKLDPAVKSKLAFGLEKLQEIAELADWLGNNDVSTVKDLDRSEKPKSYKTLAEQRLPLRAVRKVVQAKSLNLPPLPTTTIGSFPQTKEVRALRSEWRKGSLSDIDYDVAIKKEIAHAIKVQEEVGLDILVHGEFERNDMVEYFAEYLDGYAFTSFGWVQSYGSRCVKPPLIVGDVSRPRAITVDYISYAQSLTRRPVKGMLTGPITLLNWSFVREDIGRDEVCHQIAGAIKAEILDLERAGVQIIQVDEAALKEGYPLRKADWKDYESWTISAWKLATNSVRPETQIHTHMCYSSFGDILSTIDLMDADVISIETSRDGDQLVANFKDAQFGADLGPGVYDIHSPRIPELDEFERSIRQRLEVIEAKDFWINPDCGLKTRSWAEVTPALRNLVDATKKIRLESTSPL